MTGMFKKSLRMSNEQTQLKTRHLVLLLACYIHLLYTSLAVKY